jgi:hypothetical protein
MNISMFGFSIRALARRLVFCAALAMAAGLPQQAAAQSEALPEDVAQAIENAIRLSDMAAKNAAFSANIANNNQQTQIANRTRLSVSQSNLAEAVVEGIARYPRAVSAIVAAAVRRAPDYTQVIARRASIAFPRFASLIAAAAGLPPPPQTPSYLPYMIPAPTYSAYAPTPYTPIPYSVAPAKTYALPTTARTAQAVVLPPPTMTPTTATSPGHSPAATGPVFGVSELRFGIVHHDTGVLGRSKEDSVDVTMALRFLPLRGDIWDMLGNPRPFIGANINTSKETSTLFFGGNWDWYFGRQTFASFAWGGAAHTGKLETSRLDRKELGSRVLFYLAAELGYRFTTQHSLALRFDHMSNAKLTDKNEGLDTVGLIYGFHF